jgi:YcxB-like protein
MRLEYSLNENDFLQHQLFTASKSERIKKKRRKSWVIVSLATLLLSFICYKNANNIMAYSFLALAVYTIFFYPLYLKAHYKNHYKKFIAHAYKNKVGINSTISFNDTQIEIFDRTGESKIKLSEIEEITETGEYIYLRMKTGEALIIPKLKIKELNELLKELKGLAEKLNIKFISEINWKWR